VTTISEWLRPAIPPRNQPSRTVNEIAANRPSALARAPPLAVNTRPAAAQDRRASSPAIAIYQRRAIACATHNTQN
jgi:hypothetical protein